jgi:hypothetical protein
MNSMMWARVATCAAGLTVVAVLALLVPGTDWSSCTITAAALVAFSIAAPPFLYRPRLGSDGKDTEAIWLIGPSGAWFGLLLALSLLALGLALRQRNTSAWVVVAIWGGVGVAGWSLLMASTAIVGGGSDRSGSSPVDPRPRWLGILRAQEVQADDPATKHALAALGERVRFASSEHGDLRPTHNSDLDALFGKLDAHLHEVGGVDQWIKAVDRLLIEREQAIRMLRSHTAVS